MAGLQLPRVVLRCIFVWKIFEDIFTLRIIITIIRLYTYFLRIFYVYLTPPPPEDLLLPMSPHRDRKAIYLEPLLTSVPLISISFSFFSLSLFIIAIIIYSFRDEVTEHDVILCFHHEIHHIARKRVLLQANVPIVGSYS